MPRSILRGVMVFAVAAATLVGLATELPAEDGDAIRFERRQLDAVFRSEGAAVGDINGDGLQDIVAGYVWYEAPDWEMHCVLEEIPEYDPKGYSNSFCTFVDDLDGDGWNDIMVVDFPGTPTWWFRNPGEEERDSWQRFVLTPVTNNESPQYVDADGDGVPELVAAFSPDSEQADGPQRRMAIIARGDDVTQEWNVEAISTPAAPGTRKYSHGLGIGDVNGDGLTDILCARGWWQRPSDGSTGEEWTFHEAPFGEKAAQMFVYDFDGDGDSDVLASSPHDYGIWWYEQDEDGGWIKHEIDMTYSQTHAVCLADINGDGLPDFVTGKRWWAHGGRDPGGNDPAVFCWYELERRDGTARWTRHQFDHNSGPGTQFTVADVDGDGLLDVVTSNKKGVHYFRQTRVDATGGSR